MKGRETPESERAKRAVHAPTAASPARSLRAPGAATGRAGPAGRPPANVTQDGPEPPSAEPERPERHAETPPGARSVAISRDEVYSKELAEGRPVIGRRDAFFSGIGSFLRRLLTSRTEREEQDLDRRLTSLPGVSRANVISVISPKGGVGKTTSTFLIGNVLTEFMRMRVIAVDANPDFGTLAALAPDEARSDLSLLELIDNRDRLNGSAEFAPYLSRVPSGLHLAGAPRDAESMAALNPTLYRELVDFLARFYDVIILDCGTGITDPLAQFAVERCDQVVLVTTSDWITSQSVLGALRHLHADRSVVVLNQAHAGGADRKALEHVFMKQRLGTRVAVPYDDRLRIMLDSASFSLDKLDRPVRVAVKQLGLAAAEQLQ